MSGGHGRDSASALSSHKTTAPICGRVSEQVPDAPTVPTVNEIQLLVIEHGEFLGEVEHLITFRLPCPRQPRCLPGVTRLGQGRSAPEQGAPSR